MVDFEFYKELYFNELNRRTAIESSSGIPFAVLSGLWGYNAYVLKNYSLIGLWWLDTIIFISLLATFLFAFIASYFFYRSIHGYDYELIPDSISIQKYYDENKKFSINKLNNNIEIQIARCTARNQINNDTKSEMLHRSRRYVLFGVISALCYTIIPTTFKVLENFGTVYKSGGVNI